ncbi:MAG: hypothetical protein K2G67_05120, partial [Muribaculaceae bacterium]|nr:hypothetical protein [Muribaculaceae bacterium]
LPLCLQAQEESLSDPIYIAAIIVDEPSADDMTKTLEYYGFHQEGTSTDADGYTLVSRPDGARLRYRIDPSGELTLPTVEVLTIEDPRKIQEVLFQAGFRPRDKKRTTYLRGEPLSHRYTIATLSKSKNRSVLTIAKKIGSLLQPATNRKSTVDRSRKLRKSTSH